MTSKIWYLPFSGWGGDSWGYPESKTSFGQLVGWLVGEQGGKEARRQGGREESGECGMVVEA